MQTTVQQLTVLYDPMCPLCRQCRDWLIRQPKHVPLRFLPQGTADAAAAYPDLSVGVGDPVEDLIVVADDGRVWRDARAWVMCFYALREYRALAMRLSHPALLPLARRAYRAVSNHRYALGRWFGGRAARMSNDTLADHIRVSTAPGDEGCHLGGAVACTAEATVTADVVRRMNERRTNDPVRQPGGKR
ncbi:MAG: DUF393 domain-containing protein [Planctomycetota bacterium]